MEEEDDSNSSYIEVDVNPDWFTNAKFWFKEDTPLDYTVLK